jgi:DNA-binding CsgD family transcriptional regulator
MPYGSEMHISAAERPIEDMPAANSGLWKTAILHLSERNGLTRREQDILALLARGRNTSYMSSLLMISEHTVKTHVYRIYTKFNISSQQDLITIVESCVEELRSISRQMPDAGD